MNAIGAARVRAPGFWLAACLLGALASGPLLAQAQDVGSSDAQQKALIEEGRKQLAEAENAKTEEAYQTAEATFDRAVHLNPKDGLALAYRALAQMSHAGLLAKLGQFGPSGELTNNAIRDLDRAIELSPDDLTVRLLRGLSYAQFPSFMNKAGTAQADLETSSRHPKFASLPDSSRAQVFYMLGRLYLSKSDEKAAARAWQQAVEAGLDTPSGKAAQRELGKLSLPPQAANPEGKRMPDRFPQVNPETSPVIVAASITFPGRTLTADPDSLGPKMREFLENLAKQPGLLAVHRLASLDKPGMLVILTWWENKAALNRWFYSDVHQGMIHWAYGEQQHAADSRSASAPASGRTMTEAGQIAMELFTTLPGGIQYGGGIGPKLPDKPE
jgi:tetratricopeptide (TPR) repeat protein